jgi:hypothetical protein
VRLPTHPTLIRRMLQARLKQLTSSTPALAASLVQIRKHCGRASCHCLQGGPKHTAWHLTCKVDGKTRVVYVPVDLLEDVRSWIEEHRRLRRLQQEISQLTVALIRGHVRHRQRQRGRS